MKRARTEAFLQKFSNKSGLLPTNGARAFLEQPGRHQVDKRDGVLALMKENSDMVGSMRDSELFSAKNQKLYEMRDKIDHYALYEYFKEEDEFADFVDPDAIQGPFRRKFYPDEDVPVTSKLFYAE